MPLIHNNDSIKYITPEDQAQLTTWYTEHTIDFIKKRGNKPFFIYLAHSMPHTPLYVYEKFKGKSKKGLYEDVMMEIDWSLGEILKPLKVEGIENNSHVIYFSDNGPNLNYGNHGGKKGY